MTPTEVISLLDFLDELFKLGGKLIEAAIQKAPELKLEPLPELSQLDESRQEALSKVEKE